MRVLVSIVVAAAACSLASPAAAQSTAQYAALALAPGGGEPPVACGTPAIFARQVLSGFAPPGSIRLVDAGAPDVQPLWFDQNPRLLHAEHTGGLALDNLLVLGDVETLSFEHWSSSAGEDVEETWQRTRTTSIDGYLISVFNPSWDDAELWDTIHVHAQGSINPLVEAALPAVRRRPGEGREAQHGQPLSGGLSARAEKINRAWPNLHYATVTGGLVLSPSPPRIQPAQLQLIGE